VGEIAPRGEKGRGIALEERGLFNVVLWDLPTDWRGNKLVRELLLLFGKVAGFPREEVMAVEGLSHPTVEEAEVLKRLMDAKGGEYLRLLPMAYGKGKEIRESLQGKVVVKRGPLYTLAFEAYLHLQAVATAVEVVKKPALPGLEVGSSGAYAEELRKALGRKWGGVWSEAHKRVYSRILKEVVLPLKKGYKEHP